VNPGRRPVAELEEEVAVAVDDRNQRHRTPLLVNEVATQVVGLTAVEMVGRAWRELGLGITAYFLYGDTLKRRCDRSTRRDSSMTD